MSDGIIVHSTPYEQALSRLMLTSKRAAVDVVRQQAKLVFTNVAKYTPPASEGVTGKAAEKQGKAKVRADISSLYGTPSDAYEAMAFESPAKAAAFWFMNEQGEENVAASLVRDTLGKSFVPFDGGALNDRTQVGRRRRAKAKREHIFYITNPQSLDSYIQQEESHVWWLASGWQDALKGLMAKLPYGVGKLNAPGHLEVIVNSSYIEVTMVNGVKFGPEVRDIERRIKWAMNVQTEKLDRQWKYYLERAAGEAGFVKK